MTMIAQILRPHTPPELQLGWAAVAVVTGGQRRNMSLFVVRRNRPPTLPSTSPRLP